MAEGNPDGHMATWHSRCRQAAPLEPLWQTLPPLFLCILETSIGMYRSRNRNRIMSFRHFWWHTDIPPQQRVKPFYLLDSFTGSWFHKRSVSRCAARTNLRSNPNVNIKYKDAALSYVRRNLAERGTNPASQLTYKILRWLRRVKKLPVEIKLNSRVCISTGWVIDTLQVSSSKFF